MACPRALSWPLHSALSGDDPVPPWKSASTSWPPPVAFSSLFHSSHLSLKDLPYSWMSPPRCPMDIELPLPTHSAQSSCCLSIYVKGISNRLEHRWSEGNPRSASLATSSPTASPQAPGRGPPSHTWVPLPPHLLPLLLRTYRVTFKNHAPLLPYIPPSCLKSSYGFALGPE